VSTKRKAARVSYDSPPTWCLQTPLGTARKRFSQDLHFKGFRGGVPQNTETAAVKPRVGIE
jgi:hypothetical protein